MEELLMTIVKEATGSKLQNLKQAAQIAQEKLSRQHGLNRDHSYELRSVCFTALQMALETKRPKFVTYGLNGLHRIIRDERFFAGLEPEDDSLWLPAQLLRSTSCLSTTANEDTVVNVLRLILAMACSPTCTLNGRLLIEVLSKCGECWENGSRAVKAASLAAGSQCLRTFCAFLKDEAEEIIRLDPTGIISMSMAAAVYNEVIPVMQWLCSRLVEPSTGNPKAIETGSSSLYLMECILTLVVSLPSDVHANPHFTAFLWQKFCPTLAATMGSPGRVNKSKKFTYRDAINLIESENRGFFTRPGLDGLQARCIYLTSIQLLRIAGAQGSLRPMLEALFHRMLLLPVPSNRVEPLRYAREIFKSPERLIDLAIILYPDKTQSSSDDMALFRLVIDAMEECAVAWHNGSTSVYGALSSSVECIVALLESLKMLSSGNFDESLIDDRIAEAVNLRYSQLADADYSGPLTYQSMARLPPLYRDAVAELRQIESSSDSDIDAEQTLDPDVGSIGSGDTEGPEDETPSSGDDVSSRTSQGNWLWSHVEDSFGARSDGDYDRHHAREFAVILTNVLVPSLMKLKSSIEVDEALQEFASKVCGQNCVTRLDSEYGPTMLNADGIYLATFSALLLALQLMNSGHYVGDTSKQIAIPLSEQQFVMSVQNSGILVYQSSAWLRELYQCILANNPLSSLPTSQHCALIDMLHDAGGVGPTQMLSDWLRLQSVVRIPNELTPKQQAAKKIARRLLTCCWDSMVAVLAAGLGDASGSHKARLLKLSKKTLRVKKKELRGSGETLYALSLDGLQTAATLSNVLKLQHLAGKIINLIASNVCQNAGPKIPASHALSMDVVLSGALELGSHSADCWLPVFSVCRHVTQLEHDLFSSQSSAQSVGNTSGAAQFKDVAEAASKSDSRASKLNFSLYSVDDDETCIDVYSFLQAPSANSNINVSSILKAYTANDAVHLTQADTAKMLCALSHQADILFSEAAERLSLPAIQQFLKNLCRASREQLYKSSNSVKRGKKSWWLGRPWKMKNDSLPLSLLLHRIGDVTLKVFRGPRPLLHVLKVWAITGPHLMDAACHKDRSISKRAIEYIHDIITALLVEQTELPHFHFNEALLKPFENLLSVGKCDSDVQDQIVACLYEIVEAHRTEIRSGWRPLFGTLRTARNRPVHLANVIDIFRVFLETDNMLVFANAGLDCILCLLSYLEISGSGSMLGEQAPTDDVSVTMRSGDFLHDSLKFLERCATILDFMYNMPQCPSLHSTYKIKGITYTHIIDANIPSSMENLTFGQDYLHANNEQCMISYRSLHIDKESICKIDELDKPSGVLKVWFLLLDGLTNSLIVCPIAHQSSILQSIFKIFKSLLQSPGMVFGFYCINHLLIPMIQDWLRYVNKAQKSWVLIEKNFKHCCCMTTDLVVDFINKSHGSESLPAERIVIGKESLSPAGGNLMKQSKGERPSTSIKYSKSTITGAQEQGEGRNVTMTKLAASSTLALKQLLLVLIECSAQSQETIARVAVSCMKHIIFSAGYLFDEEQWVIIASAIHRASTVSMAPLKQLIFAFNRNSNSFYGDCANVKVAARRDSTADELQRIHSLAQQVFLMDSQRESVGLRISSAAGLQEDRSYSFLLHPLLCGTEVNRSTQASTNSLGYQGQPAAHSNVDCYIIRIPYRNLIVGMLTSQMLLQLIANVLLSGLSNVPSELNTCFYNNSNTETVTSSNSGARMPASEKVSKVPYLHLGQNSKEILLRALRQFLTSSIEFDTRPGLKFLIQKVSGIEYAANLYKQMNSSWIIHYMVLVDTYLNNVRVLKLDIKDVQCVLSNCCEQYPSGKCTESCVQYLLALRDLWELIADHFIHHLESDANGKMNEHISNGVEESPHSASNDVVNANSRQCLQQHTGITSQHECSKLLNCKGHSSSRTITAEEECVVQTLPKADKCELSANQSHIFHMQHQPYSEHQPEQLKEFMSVYQHQLLKHENHHPKTQQQMITDAGQQQKSQQSAADKQLLPLATESGHQKTSIPVEIEEQRAHSIQKDVYYKTSALRQLIVASIELIKLLPEEQSEYLQLLLTPRIQEAFRYVEDK
ncbi:brefeldin A-inhibited guanine nucleotide-exchange protein 3 [Anopheles bellator]|uniref:brefeldin A-inhibited guanine nucleotide-exchange protein 3 n=1 Tax=Anopheles bellator TaxID=139047 RepID=UPI0026489623|nr:brefeldin A-inhibited guanine nucleotide-exchange protein 3 [Anopheles bellator]